MQKLMFKGLLQDSQTISSSGITKGSKVMLVGSTLNDVLAVSSVSKQVQYFDILSYSTISFFYNTFRFFIVHIFNHIFKHSETNMNNPIIINN